MLEASFEKFIIKLPKQLVAFDKQIMFGPFKLKQVVPSYPKGAQSYSKVAQSYPKVAKKVTSSVFTLIMTIQKLAQK